MNFTNAKLASTTNQAGQTVLSFKKPKKPDVKNPIPDVQIQKEEKYQVSGWGDETDETPDSWEDVPVQVSVDAPVQVSADAPVQVSMDAPVQVSVDALKKGPNRKEIKALRKQVEDKKDFINEGKKDEEEWWLCDEEKKPTLSRTSKEKEKIKSNLKAQKEKEDLRQ